MDSLPENSEMTAVVFLANFIDAPHDEIIELDITKEQIVMIYIIEGELQFVNEKQIASKGQMIYFDQSSELLNLASASSKGSYLVLAGKPLNEPIVRYGPFVANFESEMKQAMLDYQNGKMGVLD